MRNLLATCTAFIIALGTATASTDQDFKGFVEIEKGRSLYVDWQKAEPSKPTVVLLNGLTYTTRYWDGFAASLRALGFGVFRYDPEGMGETLLKKGPVRDVIRIEDQARDLNLLTKAVGLTEPLHLVGLSYGGGLSVAFARDYSERVASAVLIAPYTEPLERQHSWILTQIAWTRVMFPFNPATDDELYSYFLRQNVYYVYPYLEPSVNEHRWKPEAIFQMVQGIRKYEIARAAEKFPERTAHLVIVSEDQYIPSAVLERFWEALPMSSRGSLLVLHGNEHKVNETSPEYLATWVKRIVMDKESFDGGTYDGNPDDGTFKPRE